jgi:tetratricopeptide (TPR) repeat protein
MPTLSPAPRVLPLRRARSDADLLLGPITAAAAASSATVLLRSPSSLALEERDDTPMEGCFDGAGGKGNNNNSSGRGGSGGGGGGSGSQSAGMGEHYRRVLRLEPDNPLLLRNYGNYLHEVERDLPGAEEYYGRALLACPGDADLLSLYGRVLWEADQDKDRADGYFQRAVQAAPDDWYALARAHAGRAISYRSWFFYSVCDRPNLTRDV